MVNDDLDDKQKSKEEFEDDDNDSEMHFLGQNRSTEEKQADDSDLDHMDLSKNVDLKKEGYFKITTKTKNKDFELLPDK